MERIINSNEIGAEPLRFGDQSGMLDLYDGLSTPFSTDTIVLSDDHTAQIESFVEAAVTQYGDREGNREPTFAEMNLGIPSLVVRVDCTIEDGQIVAYEMEDSPSGQGITDRIQKAVGGNGVKDRIVDHYTQMVGDVPFVIVSGARGHGTDDNSIVGDENYRFDTDGSLDVPEGRVVLVKGIPGEPDSLTKYLSLQSQTVAPMLTEGDKSYLERMGILQAIEDPAELLRDDDGNLTSQALKARLGSMAMGVSLFLTKLDQKRFTGARTVTATKLSDKVREYATQREGALVQPFVAPIRFDNLENRSNAILRVFVLVGRDNQRITTDVIGGCYVARPEMVVHGASNAVSGAVLLSGERS